MYANLCCDERIFFCFVQSEDEAGLLEQLKSQICDNVALYAQKYDEEFQPFLPDFVAAVWHLLTSTDQSPKYDLVIGKPFLSSNPIRGIYLC